MLVAGSVLAGNHWEELPLPARLGLLGVVWAVLLATGARLHGARPRAPSRARAVLWALFTAAAAELIAVTAHDGFGQVGSDLATAGVTTATRPSTVSSCATGTVAHSHDRPLPRPGWSA